MDMTTPEELKLALKILSKHTGISEADLDYKNEVEIIRPSEAEAAMREYGGLKQSPEELVNGNIDSLLSEFKRQGFDTSNWDGDEGWEKAIVDGVRSHIAQQLEELDALYDKALDLSVQQTMEARAKQSPRWVKASERVPNLRKRFPIKYDGEPMGGWFHEDGYWVTNHGHEKDLTKILWLDESGSPEPEAVEFAEWAVKNYHFETKGEYIGMWLPKEDCGEDVAVFHETSHLYNLFKQTK